MKTKILTSLALASLMSLYFVGCSSEPKSVEELSKLSKEELDKLFETCVKNAKSGKFDKDKEKAKQNKVGGGGFGSVNWQTIGEIEDISSYSKEFVECGRIFKASEEK